MHTPYCRAKLPRIQSLPSRREGIPYKEKLHGKAVPAELHMGQLSLDLSTVLMRRVTSSSRN